MQSIKFKAQNQTEDKIFKNAINEVVTAYFREKNISRFANNEMRFKIFFWLGLWSITYLSFFLFPRWLSEQPGLLFIILLLHLFIHLMIGTNIAHDANHNSLFANKKYNKILSYTFEIIGFSSVAWKILHNKKHHAYVNVLGEDNNVNGGGIIRLSAKDKWLWFHKYQFIYCFFFYSLSILNFILIKDFKLLKHYRSGAYNVSIWDIVRLFTFKILYWVFYLFLPIYFGHYSPALFLSFYFAGQLIIGLVLALVFQLLHHFENTNYPDVTDDIINESWQINIIKTSCDYATDTPAINWLFGGANYHITHHLFSNICHVHYAGLTEKLKIKVLSMGYKYNEFRTFRAAYSAHIHELKKLGREN